MSDLDRHLQEYLAVRRALGFKLVGEGQLLADFVVFADAAGQRTITTSIALEWARLPRSGSPNYLSRRLRAVRRFARYVHALDPVCEVPPLELLPASKYRPTPYLYRDREIVALMAAARRLRPPLRAATFESLIGLLACTGLRIGEAIRLDREDFDPTHRLLIVRDSKFGKSREVLLHESTIRALADYGERRDRLGPDAVERSFFITTRGTRLTHPTIYVPFRVLLKQAGIKHPSPTRRVRIHDLRHSFAVKTLLGWYRDGGDVAARMPLLSTYLGHVDPAATYWYLSAAPELLALAAERLEQAEGTVMSALAPTLEAFFTDRLINEKGASPHTIAAYRDTFRLLLGFAHKHTGKQPCKLEIEDLDAPLIAAFLDHLEHDRGNSPRTRNTRLAAIHSLFRFAALRHPEHAAVIARVLAVPTKRFDRAIVSYLTAEEVDALLAAPDRARWIGRRDHALLTLAIQTGLRVSELTSLRCQDVHLGTGAHIQTTGKGRKQRATPLTTQTVTVLRVWLQERASPPNQPLFPTSRGRALSRDAIALLTSKHADTARHRCPTLKSKTVSPHVLRHTAAMNLLHADVDSTVIALWLGHESVEATQIYLHADMAIKERALARTTPPKSTPGRYRPPDTLLAFLEAL